MVLSFFMLATAIHERYAIYALGIMAPLVVFDRRWGAMYAALSLMILLNISASLPPAQTWADLVNGPVSSMSMASANLLIYALFSRVMKM